jgi:5-methyltetrahydrofolate--homocysteine methyltransferase
LTILSPQLANVGTRKDWQYQIACRVPHVPPDSAPPALIGSLGVGGTHTQRTKAIYQVVGKAHLVFGERIRLSANNLWQSRDGGAGKVVDRGAVGGVHGYTLYGRATDKRNIFWTVRGNSLAVALEPGYRAGTGVQELKTSSTMMRWQTEAQQENVFMTEILEQIKQAVINGKHKEIEALVRTAVEEKVDLGSIINTALIDGMDVVGQQFASGEIFVPEMLIAALTMQKGLAVIKPLLKGNDSKSKGTVVIGTVKGDLHDIGKNLVSMMLEGAGFQVVDLGVNLGVEQLVDKVTEIKPDILGLSTLLTTTMPEMQKVISVMQQRGLRSSVKIMVGGAPVDAHFAEKIGADGYAKDAAGAVQLARKLVSGT